MFPRPKPYGQAVLEGGSPAGGRDRTPGYLHAEPDSVGAVVHLPLLSHS